VSLGETQDNGRVTELQALLILLDYAWLCAEEIGAGELMKTIDSSKNAAQLELQRGKYLI
jgi:hypothetical protein